MQVNLYMFNYITLSMRAVLDTFKNSLCSKTSREIYRDCGSCHEAAIPRAVMEPHNDTAVKMLSLSNPTVVLKLPMVN